MIIISIWSSSSHHHDHHHDYHGQDGEGSSALHVVTERLQEATEEETQNLVRLVVINQDGTDHDINDTTFPHFHLFCDNFSHFNLFYRPG